MDQQGLPLDLSVKDTCHQPQQFLTGASGAEVTLHHLTFPLWSPRFLLATCMVAVLLQEAGAIPARQVCRGSSTWPHPWLLISAPVSMEYWKGPLFLYPMLGKERGVRVEATWQMW